VDPLAQQATELAALVEQVVGPLELDRVVARQLSGGVAYRQARDERQLMRRHLLVDRQDERNSDTPWPRPPRMRAPAPTRRLVSGQHNRRGVQLAALSKLGRVIVGAAQPGEPVEAEGLEAGAEAGHVERIQLRCWHVYRTPFVADRRDMESFYEYLIRVAAVRSQSSWRRC
jgi:hypothetical protein